MAACGGGPVCGGGVAMAACGCGLVCGGGMDAGLARGGGMASCGGGLVCGGDIAWESCGVPLVCGGDIAMAACGGCGRGRIPGTERGGPERFKGGHQYDAPQLPQRMDIMLEHRQGAWATA